MKYLCFVVATVIMLSANLCFALDITLTIPDDKAAQVVDSFCKAYKYQDKIRQADGLLIDNPVTKGQFTKNILISFVKEITRSVAAQDAAEAARQASIVDPQNIIEVTAK